MRGTTIVFDLDGTLVDTAPDLVNATNHAMSRLGLAPVAGAILKPSVSRGARAMILKGLATHGQTLGDTEIERSLEVFLEHYLANIAAESRPFAGTRAALQALSDRGAALAVCTNKREAWSRMLLEALDLSRHFTAVAGRDTFPACKPDPSHLTGAIALAGGEVGRAVMVGDSDVDIATAKAAGVPIVAVTFGYTDIPVTELGPDAVISHYDDLEGALARILASRS